MPPATTATKHKSLSRQLQDLCFGSSEPLRGGLALASCCITQASDHRLDSPSGFSGIYGSINFGKKQQSILFLSTCRATLVLNLSHTILRLSNCLSSLELTCSSNHVGSSGLFSLFSYSALDVLLFPSFVCFSSSHFSLFTSFPGCCSGCTTVALKTRELC